MKKGFTLVELLAVLTLIAFIMIISIPIMETILYNSENKTRKAQVDLIVEAARKWSIKNVTDIAFDEEGDYFLSLTDLKKTEFMDDKEIKDPSTKEAMNGCVYINYNENTNKMKYNYVNSCNRIDTSSAETCFIFNNGTIQGYNNSKSGCTTNTLTIPTTIDGIKVTTFAGALTNNSTHPYQLQTITKLDFTHAFFLEQIADNPFFWNSSVEANAKAMVLDELDLQNNVNLKTIGANAFGNSVKRTIRKLKLPENLQVIGTYAFADNELKTLELPSKIERIESYAFNSNKLKEIEIPTSVLTVETSCFANNTLKTVSIVGKKSSSEFMIYQTPFASNPGFNESAIIWK